MENNSGELWRYYLTLERDFMATTAFSEIDARNYGTFSDRYAALMLLIGSEVDVIAKIICKIIDPTLRPSNVVQYRQAISQKYPWLYCIKIYSRQFGVQLMPWRFWSPTQNRSPVWWSAYNRVKHDRANERSAANQLNTLLALGGLYALHIYYQQLLETTLQESSIFTFSAVDSSFETHEAVWSCRCRNDIEALLSP